MALPNSIREQVQQRFDLLISEGDQLARAMREDDWSSAGLQFFAYRTKVLSLLQYLGAGASGHLGMLADDIRALEHEPFNDDKMLGVVRGLADDYASGMLESIFNHAEAEFAADYLGQGERLLSEGQSGQYDHVPAAVLIGAVLEKSLRTLCARRSISLTKPDGQPKTMNPLIDDLKKAGVFNELVAKQLRAWADIRNAAAHGDFEKFGRSDVESMQKGVESFLANHL